MNFVNKKYTNMSLFYTTPGEYLDSLVQMDLSWSTKYDDLFPYADIPEDYWSGYFSSRASSKWQVRYGS